MCLLTKPDIIPNNNNNNNNNNNSGGTCSNTNTNNTSNDIEKDVSYVSAGYAPLSVRIVQSWIYKPTITTSRDPIVIPNKFPSLLPSWNNAQVVLYNSVGLY